MMYRRALCCLRTPAIPLLEILLLQLLIFILCVNDERGTSLSWCSCKWEREREACLIVLCVWGGGKGSYRHRLVFGGSGPNYYWSRKELTMGYQRACNAPNLTGHFLWGSHLRLGFLQFSFNYYNPYPTPLIFFLP